MGIDASIISNLQNQCKALPEWGRVKIEIVRKISDELAAHMWEVRKYVSQTGCQIVFNRKENKVTIIKPKVSKEDEDLLAGLDDLNTDVDGLDKEVEEKEKKVKELERIVTMNPSREFFWIVEHFKPNFKNWNYDEIIKNLQQIKKVISHYPVEVKYYNLAMPVYKDSLKQVSNKIKDENNVEIKKKLERIRELLEYIIKHTKAKNIWLA